MSISRDQALGLLTLAGSLVGVIVYGILLFSLGDAVSLLTLQVTAFLAAASILGILAWIGYTLATTPPRSPQTRSKKRSRRNLKGWKKLKREKKIQAPKVQSEFKCQANPKTLLKGSANSQILSLLEQANPRMGDINFIVTQVTGYLGNHSLQFEAKRIA